MGRYAVTSVHGQVLLDTSVVIDYPAAAVAAHAETAAVSTITLAELAYGLHTEDPLRNAAREQRYHWISNAFEPIPFGVGAGADLWGVVRPCSRTWPRSETAPVRHADRRGGRRSRNSVDHAQ